MNTKEAMRKQSFQQEQRRNRFQKAEASGLRQSPVQRGALSRAPEEHSDLSERALGYLKGRFYETLLAMRLPRSGKRETPANTAGKKNGHLVYLYISCAIC